MDFDDYDVDDYLKKSREFDDELGIKPAEEIKTSSFEEQQRNKLLFLEAHDIIKTMLKKYSDLKEEYYEFLTLWILGTYFHKNFLTYPYVFFNAMRGGGKSRTMRLCMYLSNDGEVQTSMTEAVLFRENTPLGIDEFEGVGRKGFENLRELLNGGYKKGSVVKRNKEVKTPEGKDHVMVTFNIFRPIMMANITGMENVLGDRSIKLILEKSDNDNITNLMEIWEMEPLPKKLKKIMDFLLKEPIWCRCDDVYPLAECYLAWNNYNITHNYTPTQYTQIYTDIHYKEFFDKIIEKKINSRALELFFPLFLVAADLPNKEILEQILDFASKYNEERKQDDFMENRDVMVYDFVASYIDDGYYKPVHQLTDDFRNFVNLNDDWINPQWFGQALARLNLRKVHKRERTGALVILDVKHAQEKMKIFKPEDKPGEK